MVKKVWHDADDMLDFVRLTLRRPIGRIQRVTKTWLIAPLTTATVLFALAACADDSSNGNGSGESKPVTVPATKTDKDPSYRIKSTASVTNEDYSDGSKGTVTVSARTATKHQDSNDHWLAVRVMLKSGGSVHCEEGRSFIWSDFGVFEEISIPCDTAIDLADVQAVRVVAQ